MSEYKFKIGDKVKIKPTKVKDVIPRIVPDSDKITYQETEYEENELIGFISQDLSNARCPYQWKIDLGDGRTVNVRENEIKHYVALGDVFGDLFEDKPNFNIGDEVVVEFDGCYAEGRIFELYDETARIGFDSGEDIVYMICCFERIKLKSELENEINFPDDFYSWKDGVDIDDKQINKWIKEIQQGEYDNISSGNTIVFKNGNGIVVAKDYWSWNDFE